MTAGRPPDPSPTIPPVATLPRQTVTTHTTAATANPPPPQNQDFPQATNLSNYPPISPRMQKKSFLSVVAGENPPVIPLNREPSWYRDRPAASFFDNEIATLALSFKFSMIGKFTRMPKLQEIRTAFKGIGLVGAYNIRWLDYKHILIHLSNEHDLNRIWMKQNWFIVNKKMRVFKWTPEFHPEKESSLVPVWISFPNLRAHFYEKSTLMMIAKSVGRPLFVDEATANGTRPNVARICVEYDCQKSLLDQIWIVTRSRQTGEVTGGFIQKVEFVKMPDYCTHCCHVGHNASACLVLGNKPEKQGLVSTKPLGSKKTLTDDDSGKAGDARQKPSIDEKIVIGDDRKREKAGTTDLEKRNILSGDEPLKQTTQGEAVVGKPSMSGLKHSKRVDIEAVVAKHASVISSNRFDGIGTAEEEGQENHAKQGQTGDLNSNLMGKNNFLGASLCTVERQGRVAVGLDRKQEDRRISRDELKADQYPQAVYDKGEELIVVEKVATTANRNSTHARVAESWQIGADTNDSVEQVGDFDGVKWALEAGQVTIRKPKKENNNKTEDRLSVAAVYGEGLTKSAAEQQSENVNMQSESLSLNVEKVQDDGDNSSKKAVCLSQLESKRSPSQRGCFHDTVHLIATDGNAPVLKTAADTCDTLEGRDESDPHMGLNLTICGFNKALSIVPSNGGTSSSPTHAVHAGSDDTGSRLSPVQPHAVYASDNLEVHPCVSRRRKSESSLYSQGNWNSLNASKPMEERLELWNCLRSISWDMQGPWMVGGDFNSILNSTEWLHGAQPHSGSMEDFATMLLDCGLLDASYEGNNFTWTNNHMFQRLDRVVYNHEWADCFHHTRIQHLNRDGSDHCPLLISCNNTVPRGPSNFRFLHAWTHHHDFIPFVERSWKVPMQATGMLGFWQKLQRLKRDLKWWNKHIFGDIFHNLKLAESEAAEKELLFQQDPSILNRNLMHKAYAKLNYDIVIFTNGCRSSLQKILNFLQEYEQVFGQQVNHQKSCFITANGCALSRRQIISHTTGFHHKTLPVTYLGAPLHKGPKKVFLFDSLISKIRDRISGWENKILSPGGRITLLRSVQSSQPMYLLQVLKPPVTVIEKIERLFNSFLWGDSNDGKKLHWTAWSKITFPVSEGGLDIRNLRDNIRWRIGKGELFFWHDCWMGDQPLATLCPSFHNDMSHVHKFYNGDVWDIEKLNSCLPTSLVDEILQIPFDRSQEDVAYWALTSNGDFSFWSAWEAIRQRQTPNALFSFIWHKNGNSKSNQNAAGGRVLRDHTGKLAFAFSENLGPRSSLQAELHALL
ncbi:Uncharacterized protein TCM_016772 [Theobroma cacao]|uniref:DUF4283 domain-containing protein n=1 Tax=Theobroma cacao TaxID=3641 RepID=A0A061EB88_THECC|nr:Uncharacterized protein TCM_016772 [Theobroma cacao]